MIDAEQRAAQYREHVAHLCAAYAEAAEVCGYDTLVIHASVAAKHSQFDDQYWPMRITPAFAHWLPLVEAEATLVIRPGLTPALHRVVTSDFWDGPPRRESDHFWVEFDAHEHATAYAIGNGLPSRRVAFIGEHIARANSWGIAAPYQNPQPLLDRLDSIRLRKTAYEVSCIAEASARAAVGHQRLRDAFVAGGGSELELHLMYLAVTHQDDADTPYKNIVAIDEHAAILHHVHYGRSRIVGDDHSLLVDAGARCLGYAADITRTIAKGKSPGARRFSALVDGVDRLQREICRRTEPGVSFESLHDQTHRLLAGVLREAEISTASEDELVAEGVTRAFLPHGLGHSLGIQVHDVGARAVIPRPDNPYLRATFDVAVGQVFTIEPGCYFIGSLLDPLREKSVSARLDWDLIAALTPFGGIRIEDNLAVLREGTVNLTRDNWPGAH